jgi:quinol monooxygenase YgiN
MYTRNVTMRLKPRSVEEFTKTIENDVLPVLHKQKGFQDELTFVAPDGTEAVGISLWDGKDSADAYVRGTYPQVLKALSKVIDGTPQVRTYDVCNSTFHKIASHVAVAV